MDFYVYIYLDSNKNGSYEYGDYCFLYEPFYVGKGCRRRMYHHVKHCESNNKKNNRIRKLLNSNKPPFIFKVASNLSESEAFSLEMTLIQMIGRSDLNKGPLLNLTDGGEGSFGYKHSEDAKKRMKESRKKYISENPEAVIRGKAHYLYNKKSWMYNKQHSKESKDKISNAKKGKSYEDITSIEKAKEWREKISNSSKGRIHRHTQESKDKISNAKKGKSYEDITSIEKAKEWREKISNSNKGPRREDIKIKYQKEANGFFGKTHTVESKEKMSKKLKGRDVWNKNSKIILQYDFNDVLLGEFYLNDIQEMGISKSNVVNVCSGKRKSAGGYKWKYK